MASTPTFWTQADDMLAKIIPRQASCDIPLTKNSAAKAFCVVAVAGIALAAMQSWSSFVGTIIFEVLVGLLVLWLCRHCDQKLAWTVVGLNALLPVFTVVAVIVGLAMIASGPKK
jgi:hypothetical protein